jgi:hypothetical protein
VSLRFPPQIWVELPSQTRSQLLSGRWVERAER